MVCVRFDDLDNLRKCENFLRHAFPGTIERDGNTLNLTLDGSLTPEAERTVVERLLWACRQQSGIDDADGIVVDTERPTAESDPAAQT